MKKTVKSKYILLVVALFFISVVIILSTNNNSSDVTTKPVSNNMDNVIDKDQKEKSNMAMHFLEFASPGLENKTKFEDKNGEENYSEENYIINNPNNLKLKGLIEEAGEEVEDLPQYVWEPIRFTENDINEHIANLEKIVLYINRVKNSNSIEDRVILSNLISNEIKDKIEYFESFCADVWQISVARNDDDQKIIDDDFSGCNESVKVLEDKLNDYETKY